MGLIDLIRNGLKEDVDITVYDTESPPPASFPAASTCSGGISVSTTLHGQQIVPHRKGDAPATLPYTASHQAADFEEAIKARTTQFNTISRGIEAEERLARHQQKIIDANALQFLEAQLNSQLIRPLQRTLAVGVQPPLNRLPVDAENFVRALGGENLGRRQISFAGLLGATLAATRGNWAIRDASGRVQAVTGYIIAAAPSGFGKSDVMSVLRRPFAEAEHLMIHDVTQNRVLTVCQLKALLKAAKATATQKQAKILRETGDLDEAIESSRIDFGHVETIESRLQAAQSTPKILFDHVTMEQLPFEMAAQGGVATILDAEGGMLPQIRQANDAILLKGFTAEEFMASTRSSGNLTISHPCLAICVFVQPGKLAHFLAQPWVIDHGLAARFLYVLSGNQAPESQPIVPEAGQAWYQRTIRHFLAIPRPHADGNAGAGHILTLSRNAEGVLEAFHMTSQREYSGAFEAMRLFANRLPHHAKNLAAAIHLLRHTDRAEDHEIDESCMEGGIACARFFAEHALTALDQSHRDGRIYADKIFGLMARHRWWRFSERDAHRGIGSGRCSAAQIRAGLDELERANYVRRYHTSTRSTIYVVHSQAYMTPLS